MSYQELDQIFPYFVFFYGILVSFVLSFSALMQLAEQRLPKPLLQQFFAHRTLGYICMVVGGLWILQNLWVG